MDITMPHIGDCSIREVSPQMKHNRNTFKGTLHWIDRSLGTVVKLCVLLACAYSAPASAAWDNSNPPHFSSASGSYSLPLSITISDPKSSGATIYYTTNGGTPTNTSTLYTAPVAIPLGTSTLQAVAYNGGRHSTVTSETYIVTGSSSPLITVSASGGTSINPHSFGVNNIWYNVPDTSFDAFTNSLQQNAGMTLMRYPGGYESESYNWSNNTLDPTYKHYTATPGATPAHVLNNMGSGNVTFVMRTEDALEANTDSEYQSWAARAANLVTTYGGRVHDWQIGNEWYNDRGAPKNYSEFLKRYSKLVSYFAPAMKAAAAQMGFSINIYVSCNWVKPDDMTTMKNQVGASAWTDVDGIDIHIYTGINPSTARNYVPLPIPSIQPTIASIKLNSGKNLVYVSEWMADLRDNNNYGGLQNANFMMQIFGQFAQSGITEAAYWPPVVPSTQLADKVTLVNDSGFYAVDADGQALGWLSANYLGSALSTSVANSTVNSIAAKNGNQVVVFIMGGTASNETEQVQVSGFSWSHIVSAQVMYATNVSSGPATITSLPASVGVVGGKNTAQFVINPGGTNRGSAWEIVKLVLQ